MFSNNALPTHPIFRHDHSVGDADSPTPLMPFETTDSQEFRGLPGGLSTVMATAKSTSGVIGRVRSCHMTKEAQGGSRTKWWRTKWYGQNGIHTKCHWTKWYGQNGTVKMVRI